MKRLVTVLTIAALTTACSSINSTAKKTEAAPQETTKKSNTLPTEEKAFVAVIKQYDKKAIIENLGEPAKADDVKLKGTDKVVASIWEYHFINTDENGEYFPITELDFIDDKVVQVVFINKAEAETDKDNQVYKFPENKPME
jgi:photosystem II stability/assembly factor-like uncharacterized protein